MKSYQEIKQRLLKVHDVIIISVLFLLVYACETATLDLDSVYKDPPVRTIISTLAAGDTLSVFIGDTETQLSNYKTELPEPQNVLLICDADTFQLHADTLQQYYNSDVKLREGSHYKIVVQEYDGSVISAETIIPTNNVQLLLQGNASDEDLDHTASITIQNDMARYFSLYGKSKIVYDDLVRISLTRFEILGIDEFVEYYSERGTSIYQESTVIGDASFELDRFQIIWFQNHLFNNGKLDLLLAYHSLKDEQIRLYVDVMTEDGWRYIESLHKVQMASGDMFSIPARLYTNVDGGAGIFVGVKTIELNLLN